MYPRIIIPVVVSEVPDNWFTVIHLCSLVLRILLAEPASRHRLEGNKRWLLVGIVELSWGWCVITRSLWSIGNKPLWIRETDEVSLFQPVCFYFLIHTLRATQSFPVTMLVIYNIPMFVTGKPVEWKIPLHPGYILCSTYPVNRLNNFIQ